MLRDLSSYYWVNVARLPWYKMSSNKRCTFSFFVFGFTFLSTHVLDINITFSFLFPLGYFLSWIRVSARQEPPREPE